MKINNFTLNQKENQFEQNLNYEEWLRDNCPEPTSNEIDKMQKVFCSANILKAHKYHALNNLYYKPLQGA